MRTTDPNQRFVSPPLHLALLDNTPLLHLVVLKEQTAHSFPQTKAIYLFALDLIEQKKCRLQMGRVALRYGKAFLDLRKLASF